MEEIKKLVKQRQSEFSDRVEELKNKAFSLELKKGEVFLDDTLNSLSFLEIDYYKSGEVIMSKLSLSEDNKRKLSNVIIDFKAYNELVNLTTRFDANDEISDLTTLIDYEQTNCMTLIVYDKEKGSFYYEDTDDDY